MTNEMQPLFLSHTGETLKTTILTVKAAIPFINITQPGESETLPFSYRDFTGINPNSPPGRCPSLVYIVTPGLILSLLHVFA